MERITAVMPVKNASFFAEAIVSDLKINCGPSDEILVINDFSTDDTCEIFSKLIGDDPRFKIIQNEIPGLSNALNLGIQNARHDWIARFDCDDRYSANRLAIQREFLSNEVVCLFSDYSVHDEDAKLVVRIPSPVFDTCTKLSFIKNSRTPHPSVIFNRKKAIDSGGYRSTEFPAEDLGLWLRMSNKGKCISVPEELLRYTIRENSVTSQKQYEMIDIKNSMIRHSTIFQELFLDVDLNWRTYFHNYELYEQSFERKLLLLVDYFTVGRKLKFDYFGTTLSMFLSLIRDLTWPQSIVKLLWGRHKLRSIRKSKTK